MAGGLYDWGEMLDTVLDREFWRRNASDKHFWKRNINKVVLGSLYYGGGGHPDGFDVMTEDWDTLVILDACRLDTFEDRRPADWPPVESRTSRAANTWNFYRHNFQDGPYSDTVVVTSNPRAVQHRGDQFHDVVRAYDSHWDDDLGTVRPEAMVEVTLQAHEDHPNKRILSHWIQPHYPFIGEHDLGAYDFHGETVWADLSRGRIDPDVVYEAYVDNLDITFPHVEALVDAIDGRIVVTSDHGNAFGEKPSLYPFEIFGHPRGIYLPCLVDVPWVVFDGETRREIVSGDVSNVESGEDVSDRLAHLGYVE